MFHGSILDLNKKRKLQSELLGLPTPKHTCLGRGSAPSCSTFQGYPELGQLQPIVTAKATYEEIGSGLESADGSNSFMEGSVSSTMSVSAKLLSTPSTSTAIWSSENQTYSSDSNEANEMEIRAAEEDINSQSRGGPINLRQMLEEQLLEFTTHADYNGIDLMEQSGDNRTEDVLYSSGMNPNSYVLSSGRWIVEQEGQATTRKPTIDKEFEQYFSMLML
ncbi:hypothetical protein CDL15_Pgr007839 [Punica granatum]|nr:hypothetical protein CDL15_Pgr007839 [Punica granatum]